MNKVFLFLTAVLTWSCVENYELPIEDHDQGLVVEAYLSDRSYNETLNYPSEGRYFSVILSRTSNVSNIRDSYESGAIVYVQDQTGNSRMYTENISTPGHYYLYDQSFQAEYDESYQLVVVLDNQDTIRSAWEELPVPASGIGNVNFTETEKQKYVYEAEERVLRTLTGVEVTVDIPKHEDNIKHFYKWEFQPMWIYIAPYAVGGERCWVTNNYYLNDITLLEDASGGYPKNLFFIETPENDRILRYFSVLIVQQRIDEPTYRFWSDLQNQKEVGGLFDEPPFSLRTNYTSGNPDLKVMGHFNVAVENATRWEFDISELSYPISNDLKKTCDEYRNFTPTPLTPPPACFSCLNYVWGEPTVIPPSWWNE